MEAELEIQAALELELEADKLLADLIQEKATVTPKSNYAAAKNAPSPSAAARSPSPSYQSPSTRSPSSSTIVVSGGVCEESLVNKKVDHSSFNFDILGGQKGLVGVTYEKRTT